MTSIGLTAGRRADARPATNDLPADELIVLVDGSGRPTGTAQKWSAHHAQTPLHLAFSCYVFDSGGRFLVTRRAFAKKVWPGVWSNTVCGHPAPGESFDDAIARRLGYELGMTAGELEVVLPDHVYRAPPFRGIVEHEFCPVYVARLGSAPEPNPDEVADYAWMAWPQFVARARHDAGETFSWWCKNQLRELVAHPLVERYAQPAAS
jgi:isopentenyl-diphosphate delta-isomerase